MCEPREAMIERADRDRTVGARDLGTAELEAVAGGNVPLILASPLAPVALAVGAALRSAIQAVLD